MPIDCLVCGECTVDVTKDTSQVHYLKDQLIFETVGWACEKCTRIARAEAEELSQTKRA